MITISTPIQIVSNLTTAGYLPGWQQPLAIIVLRLPGDLDRQAAISRLHARLLQIIPELIMPSPATISGDEQFGLALLATLKTLLTHCRFLQLAEPQCEIESGPTGSLLRLLVPSFGVLHSAINATVHALVHLMFAANPGAAEREQFKQVLGMLEMQRPAPGISTRLLLAAVAQGIPWLHITQNIYQFGWGRAACLFDGSFTEHTRNLAARMARFKHVSLQVLRQAGLPVPAHELATSESHALAIAARLGYPVVVKPASLERGLGVSPGLLTPAAVGKAFRQARAHADSVLVEKQLAGRDYRVMVLNGKVISVAERIPGGVTGDGQHDIAALLQQTNADPLRQPAAQQRYPLVLDDEARELLQEQGLLLTTVIAAGRVVRLRRIPNIARGGTAEYHPTESVHPDNLLICVRAAGALRLDLAGIDLILPDIRQSWRQTGGGICEVNAQPDMQPALPQEILRLSVREQGRIPVVMVLVDELALPLPAWLVALEKKLAKLAQVAGIYAGQELRVNGALVGTQAIRSAAFAAQVMLRDTTLATAVFIIDDSAQLNDGAPVDRLDLLVVATKAGSTLATSMLARLAPRTAACWSVGNSMTALATTLTPTAHCTLRQLPAALAAFLEQKTCKAGNT